MRTVTKADLRSRIQTSIDATLAHQRDVLAELGPDVDDLVAAIDRLLRGGKRLRALFLYWGYRAGGQPDSDALITLATSMEFFQAAALLHDDVMDESDTRRGQPAAHRHLAAEHRARAWAGDSERFGMSGAILAGNLCLNWCDELFVASDLPVEHLARGRAVFDRMRTQLMAGQYLDLAESVRPWSEFAAEERVARAHHVIRYKSAKYSIEHPLLIGASAAGVGAGDLAALSRYGLALGEAFQLRDDVLGVFGDPAATGKPAGDDLREGKRTVLVAHALAGATATGVEQLEAWLGDPDLTGEQVDELRRIIVEAGALDRLESDIARLVDEARAALAATTGLEPGAQGVLEDLIEESTARAA